MVGVDRIRVPFMVVMVGLYVAGATFAGIRWQRIVAGLVLVTYLAAGLFFRYVPGAFGS